MRFFFYGTLRDPEVRRIVLGRELADAAGRDAMLSGHRIARVAGAAYPVLLADPAGRAAGVVFDGFSDAEAARLDRYEGDGYRRDSLELEAAGGETVSAWVYLPRGRPAVDRRPWSFEAWLREERAGFLAAIAAGGRAADHS